jgi:CRP-like cAMP-binding protein
MEGAHVANPNSPEVFQTYLERVAGVALPDFHIFLRAAALATVEPRELLFDAGSTDRRFYFILDGVLSVATSDRPGRDWIRRFVGPGELLSSVPSLAHPVPRAAAIFVGLDPDAEGMGPSAYMHYSARAITRVRARYVDIATFWALSNRHREWQQLALVASIASSALQEKRERELLTLNAEERYRVLVRERPELVELVPQKDLARYIGVTPVAMSRIVSRVRHGNATESARRPLRPSRSTSEAATSDGLGQRAVAQR